MDIFLGLLGCIAAVFIGAYLAKKQARTFSGQSNSLDTNHKPGDGELPTVTHFDYGNMRFLHLGSPAVQGSMKISKPLEIHLEYQQRMMAWLLFADLEKIKHLHAMHRSGWQVQVLEKSTTPLTSRGTGIATHAGLMKVMELAGARFGDALGTPINTRKAFDASGNIIAQLGTQQVMASWSRLLSFLLEALPSDLYRMGKMVTSIEAGDAKNKAIVHLAGEESIEADLVVAADGYRSWSRHHLFNAPPPEYAGYVAWRAMAPLARLDKVYQDLLHDGMMVSQLPGDQILGYPVMPSDNNNDVHINIVWYRKTDTVSLKILLTDEQGVQHSDGIAPKLIHPQVLQNLKQQAADTLHPAWAQIIQLAPEIFMQPIYDSVTNNMARSRVALIGDAAFISRPHIGQGVTKAAGDALCLVKCLQSNTNDVLKALPIFSNQRVTIGHQVIQYAQRLGSVISQPGGELASWSKLYSNVANVLRDTAVELDGVAYV